MAKVKKNITTTKPSAPAKIERTTEALLDVLLDDVAELRAGNITPGRMNAVSRAMMTACEVVRLNMDYAKHQTEMREHIGLLADANPFAPRNSAKSGKRHADA